MDDSAVVKTTCQSYIHHAFNAKILNSKVRPVRTIRTLFAKLLEQHSALLCSISSLYHW